LNRRGTEYSNILPNNVYSNLNSRIDSTISNENFLNTNKRIKSAVHSRIIGNNQYTRNLIRQISYSRS